MKPAVQVKCPNCEKLLRVPPDMLEVALKCKHCGYLLQLKKKPATVGSTGLPSAPATTGAKPVPVEGRASSSSNGYAPPPLSLDDLPELPPVARTPAPAGEPRPQSSGPIARERAPAPLVEPLPEAAPTDFNPAFERAGRRHTGRGVYKGPRDNGNRIKLIAVGSIILLGAGVLGTIIFKPELFQGKAEEKKSDEKDQAGNSNIGTNPGTGTNPSGTRPIQAGLMGAFPRRVLAIGITNYLYANPIQYGTSLAEKDNDRRDFYKAIDRLVTSWKIPKDEVFYLTDGPLAENKVDQKHPPLKMVVNGTIDAFLETSRPQDRIVIFFAGHAVEKDGEAYLVPLEGELEEIGTLIPLKEIYAKLDKCVAQEKLIVFDVCRFDPGRGVERPSFGVMTEGLQKALHNSPDGVSVWTSCAAGQYSYEFEYNQVDFQGLRKMELYGSVFFSLFFAADSKGRMGKSATGNGMHQPSDPLPIETLSEFIDSFTTLVVKDLEKKEQTPKLTYKRRKEWLAYDKDQPLAKKFDFPEPPPTAKREEVIAMFKEIGLPPIKAVRKETEAQKMADNFPFTKESLEGYGNNGPSFEDIQKAPEKYNKDYPLRVATVEALVEMRKLKQGNTADELPERFNSPITDADKKKITDKYQRTITTRQAILEELKDNLEEINKKRDMEKSKRWLANYDYAYAQVRARLAYIYEYNLALGKVKLETLPELSPSQLKNGGWRLASTQKMISPKEIRDMADEAKSAMTELAKANPNTPWAVLAKAQRSMALGLNWQPSSFGSDE